MTSKKAKDGYRSGLEREVAAKLRSFRVSFRYEPRRIEYRSRVKGGICDECGARHTSQVRHYTPDFTVGRRPYVIEVKGRLTSADRSKLRAVQAQGTEVRLIFRYDNKISRKGKARYSDWCEKYGFKWTVLKDLTQTFL